MAIAPDRKAVQQSVLTVLAANMSCSVRDLLSDGVSIHAAERREGAFRFPNRAKSLQAASIGNGAVVSCSIERLEWVIKHAGRLSRGQLFSIPTLALLDAFVKPDHQYMAGPDQKYVCSVDRLVHVEAPDDIIVRMQDRNRIMDLYAFPHFKHALSFRADSPRPDRLAAVAEYRGEIVGIAGASEDCELMWQIGVDVLPDYQGRGIGRALVGKLAKEVLHEGITPYYSTEVSNLKSRQLAVSLGFWPAWIEVYAR
ncbi:GNAT family N-acetyltransferase [Paenibacillus silvisoli]|uniref:GNAT family N-acetyltransferase n=1 Tax=Paenibacillus silvisoli TaxID=3110539 RepID=UPI0028060387|nr:GNAT family N-acetyltransferase [Paenibacillus silvisoli]